ncbi:adenylosuccinate lyase [Aquimarina algicola]|uniref:Adenylosuccinate lyase n=1 Tax=Aquimarina algicola TaxID=2589995 RepID=A0A504IV07_9FLAO|nr:adenylosuccinate lyase [Aquimarina algicola]TPN82327.1 adenylosuccinate lyase [Aquimarina algicola]
MTAIKDVIDTIDHSREKRAYVANLLLDHPELLPELLSICELVDEKISCRASWALEFVCKNKLNILLPYLDSFISIVPKVYQDPAVRPMAKIFEYLALAFYTQKKKEVQQSLHKEHREQMVEIGFDWLITDQKVATKAYTMTTLYLLGTEFDWVHPELKTTLELNYNTGSAAYKARSRMILKKLQSKNS